MKEKKNPPPDNKKKNSFFLFSPPIVCGFFVVMDIDCDFEKSDDDSQSDGDYVEEVYALKKMAQSESAGNAPAAAYELQNTKDFYTIISIMIRYFLFVNEGKKLPKKIVFHPNATAENCIKNVMS